MSADTPSDPREELRDRLIELALEETLGGVRPRLESRPFLETTPMEPDKSHDPAAHKPQPASKVHEEEIKAAAGGKTDWARILAGLGSVCAVGLVAFALNSGSNISSKFASISSSIAPAGGPSGELAARDHFERNGKGAAAATEWSDGTKSQLEAGSSGKHKEATVGDQLKSNSPSSRFYFDNATGAGVAGGGAGAPGVGGPASASSSAPLGGALPAGGPPPTIAAPSTPFAPGRNSAMGNHPHPTGAPGPGLPLVHSPKPASRPADHAPRTLAPGAHPTADQPTGDRAASPAPAKSAPEPQRMKQLQDLEKASQDAPAKGEGKEEAKKLEGEKKPGEPALDFVAPIDPAATAAVEAEVDTTAEAYAQSLENPFQSPLKEPLSTFSIDVDTASYTNVRRFILQNQMLPPPDAVRLEEMVNYFTYDYAGPKGEEPFSANLEVAACPWAPKHRLVRVGLKGKEVDADKRPVSNLVFLFDVSGSMSDANKLPLLKQSFRMMVDKLGENDRVAIVVYAGASGLVLPSTRGDDKAKILEALDRLEAGGSTNGGAGIELAYQTAAQNFVRGGINRVILASDGDFNVGTTSIDALEALIREKAQTGVFLTVLAFGQGNVKDATMERLADRGNGAYGYVDSLAEGRKILVEQMSGTLLTIAKDVKIQVEFNPSKVKAYRLLGYENRMLAAEDFNDDAKDAGEIGAGHTVTAFYEIIPAGLEEEIPGTKKDELKYQKPAAEEPKKDEAAPAAKIDPASKELLTVKMKYKKPDAGKSEAAQEFPLVDEGKAFGQASPDFQFASAVAHFGLVLRHSKYAPGANLELAFEVAQASTGTDKAGYRREFLEILKQAKQLKAAQGK